MTNERKRPCLNFSSGNKHGQRSGKPEKGSLRREACRKEDQESNRKCDIRAPVKCSVVKSTCHQT